MDTQLPLQTDLRILLIVCFGIVAILGLILFFVWFLRKRTQRTSIPMILQVGDNSVVDLYNYEIPGKKIATRPPKSESRRDSHIVNIDSASTIAEVDFGSQSISRSTS
jgi:hypothetical protein